MITIGEHEYRLIAVMHDGTTVEKDYTWNPNRSDNPLHWFSSYKTVQMANLVVCVHLRSGRTEVVKNRWGDDGTVEREKKQEPCAKHGCELCGADVTHLRRVK